MKVIKKVIIILNLIYSTFIFSPDAPRDELWRQTYKKFFIKCIKEGISKHYCNLHCIHKADEEFYKKQNNMRRLH